MRVQKDMGHIHDHCWKLLGAAASLPLTPQPFSWPPLHAGISERDGGGKLLGDLRIGIHVANKNPLKRMTPATTAALIAALEKRFSGRCSYLFTPLASEPVQVVPVPRPLAPAAKARCHDWSGRLSAAGLIEHIRDLSLLSAWTPACSTLLP